MENKDTKRINQGYEIINSMILTTPYDGEVEVVMGYNNRAASPYATWLAKPGKEDSYYWGHYSSNREEAMQDFFERGMNSVSLKLREIYKDENAIEDIKMVLGYDFIESHIESLLKNESFKSMAMHKYYNIDHSDENEALSETLLELYEDLVREKKIFSFGTIEECTYFEGTELDKNIEVETVHGERFVGTAYFPDERSLTTLILNTEKGYVDLEISDIATISSLKGQIFPDGRIKLHNLEDLKQFLEDREWNVYSNPGSNDKYWDIRTSSPAGEDFIFSINHNFDVQKAVESIKDYTYYFDPDEHFDMMYEAGKSGLEGVPEASVLLEDAKDIKKMLEQLSNDLSKVSIIKSENLNLEDKICHAKEIIATSESKEQHSINSQLEK